MRDNAAQDFFEALGEEGPEGAVLYLNRTSFQGGGVDGREPSPRAQALIKSGEWDAKKLLRLYDVNEDACWGVLPTYSVVEGGPGYPRFCPARNCTISSHQRQKVEPAKQVPGWYLEAGGGVNKGACLDFYLPFGDDGPVSGAAVARLIGPHPFRLTHGQWRWVMEEYRESQQDPPPVETVVEDDDDVAEEATLVEPRVAAYSDDESIPQDEFEAQSRTRPGDKEEEEDERKPAARPKAFSFGSTIQSGPGESSPLVVGLAAAKQDAASVLNRPLPPTILVNPTEDQQEDEASILASIRSEAPIQATGLTQDELESMVEGVVADFVERRDEQLRTRIEEMIAEFDRVLKRKLAEQLKGFDAKLGRLKDSLTEDISKLETEVNALIRSDKKASHDIDKLRRDHIDVRGLESQISNFRAKVNAMGPLDGTTHGLSDEDLDSWDRIKFEVLDGRGALTVLQGLVSSLREKAEGGGDIHCHGLTFSSELQTDLWLKHDGGGSVELYQDARAIANSITETVVTKEAATKGVEARAKAKVPNDLYAGLMSSFEGKLPPILAGSKADAESSTFDCLKAQTKTFDKWDPSGSERGLSTRFTKGVDSVISRLEIKTRQDGLSGDAQVLAVGLRTDSASFLKELASWKTAVFRKLLEQTNIERNSLWDMYMESEATIWEELTEQRAPYADAGHTAGGYWLFGELKAWKVQERYRRNNIHNDPALTGIFTRQLLFHGQDVSVREALDRVLSQANKAETTSKAAAGEVKAMAKKVKDLEKDMKAIKDKGLIS